MPPEAYKDELSFQNALRELADPSVLTDKYNLSRVLSGLSLAHFRICRTSKNYENEFSQRRGVDDVIEIAFSARKDAICQFLAEKSYRLKECSSPDAVSDTLVTLPAIGTRRKIQLAKLKETIQLSSATNMYWSTATNVGDFSIIVFAVATKGFRVERAHHHGDHLSKRYYKDILLIF